MGEYAREIRTCDAPCDFFWVMVLEYLFISPIVTPVAPLVEVAVLLAEMRGARPVESRVEEKALGVGAKASAHPATSNAAAAVLITIVR